jgi:tRNA (guanosine-2'-O-)-methyltransferase
MELSYNLKKELSAYLSEFVSQRRLKRFNEVLNNRTSHIRVVLENIYQAHNASAILRSCDCFGIQNVHFIENNNKMKISDEVAMGSSNWLTIHRHNKEENNSIKTLLHLKVKGYKIIAVTPHSNDISLEQLKIDEKLALVFGTEMEGISKEVQDNADAFLKIPMYGFTESLNVSVCAALCMFEITRKMKATSTNYCLTEDEKTDVYFEWLKNSVEFGEALIKNYLINKKM